MNRYTTQPQMTSLNTLSSSWTTKISSLKFSLIHLSQPQQRALSLGLHWIPLSANVPLAACNSHRRRQRRHTDSLSVCQQFLNGFIFGINIPESHSYKCQCKKDYKSIYTISCTELDKSIHSIQNSSCRSRDSFAVQSAKAH